MRKKEILPWTRISKHCPPFPFLCAVSLVCPSVACLLSHKAQKNLIVIIIVVVVVVVIVVVVVVMIISCKWQVNKRCWVRESMLVGDGRVTRVTK